MRMAPGTESVNFAFYPWGYFYVAYDYEILKQDVGWGNPVGFRSVSSAAPMAPVSFPTVNHPELTVPNRIENVSAWMKSEVKPVQRIFWPGPPDPAHKTYEFSFPVPSGFLKNVKVQGDLLLAVKVRFSEENGSAKTDPKPDVTIDVGQWLSRSVVAFASTALSGRSWVFRTLILGAAQVVPSATLRCKFDFPSIEIYNTKFDCNVDINGVYYRAFFDASLIPAPSLDLDGDGSDEDVASDLSSVGSDLVMV